MKKNTGNLNLVPIMLRVGLGLVFLYAGVSSVRNPSEWLGYMPTVLSKYIASSTLLKIFAFYELLLVIWLLSGKYIKYCALVCALTLFGIVVANSSQLFTTFRDVGLAFAALALFFYEEKNI